LYNDEIPSATLFDGEIEPGVELRIGEYEQETDERFLSMGLGEAIRTVYADIGIDIQTTEIKKLLAQYLFDPVTDEKQHIRNLSGGQKARFQIIKMLANNPNLLILDEPTNHLDLPSIEELESALLQFHGAILYISHDSYFVKKLGGDVISIKKGEE
jgi:ATP-binding cassette, subfamily F, member 3